MKRSESLVMGGWLLGAVVFVLVMVLGTAEATRMYTFADYGDFSTCCYINMADGDNLLVRDGGVDMFVTAAGYGAGSWHLGLTNAEGFIVGWAFNPAWTKEYEGYDGWIVGKYSGTAPVYDGGTLIYKGLANGEKPVHTFLVYDSTDNGWDIIGGQVGSAQDLLDGDLFFTEKDILFGGVLGDVSKLPIYPLDSTAILPHMVVVILPLTPDFNYLLILSEYWLRDDCSALNDHCEGADDWNPDGKVNFLDFAELASRW